jgi:hypothetical protein
MELSKDDIKRKRRFERREVVVYFKIFIRCLIKYVKGGKPID